MKTPFKVSSDAHTFECRIVDSVKNEQEMKFERDFLRSSFLAFAYPIHADRLTFIHRLLSFFYFTVSTQFNLIRLCLLVKNQSRMCTVPGMFILLCVSILGLLLKGRQFLCDGD